MGFLALPSTAHYTIRNLSQALPGADGTHHFVRRDLTVRDGLICTQPSARWVDGRGALVLPAFVDMHTHLDKGHIWPRTPNPDGTFAGALGAVHDDRNRRWSCRDVRQRMEFSLACAYAHGTRAIRTHLDSASPQHLISWPVFREVRQDWSDRIELQAVTLLSIEEVDVDGTFVEIADLASACSGALGCVTYPCGDLESRLQAFFAIAEQRAMDVDLHVDETHDTASNTLRIVAEVMLDSGFSGRVTAGHCCALARQPEDVVESTIDLVAEAGISVVSLPMCNLYLQDRCAGRTPRWRGVTPVHELDSRGVEVCFASDNTRDPFYAYGDMDMLEVMREATRICHLDHTERPWLKAFSQRPAQVCGFRRSMLRPGDSADFIIFSARNWTELLARPQSDRVVVRSGKAIQRVLPEYSQLDELMSEL